MSMRVGLIAPPWVPVPPPKYGGTEAVVDVLARALARRGHEVVLFTTGDATCPVERRWVFERSPEPVNDMHHELRHVQAAYDALTDCDILHDHTVLGPMWSAATRVRTPVVSTWHNLVDARNAAVLAAIGQWTTLTAISRAQYAAAPDVDVAAVVHHGLDLDRFPLGEGSGGFLVFVGRMAPEKGVREAVTIAHRAGLPLRVVTKMRSAREVEYFRREVEPVAGPDVEFLGEVDTNRRNQEMGAALALLNPIQWQEPFGLVMIEALACGTPVLSFPRGAAPEIVRPGVTGFLPPDIDSAVADVARVGDLDRAACRASVEQDFTADRMAAEYERVYADVRAGANR